MKLYITSVTYAFLNSLQQYKHFYKFISFCLSYKVLEKRTRARTLYFVLGPKAQDWFKQATASFLDAANLHGLTSK